MLYCFFSLSFYYKILLTYAIKPVDNMRHSIYPPSTMSMSVACFSKSTVYVAAQVVNRQVFALSNPTKFFLHNIAFKL